MSMENYDVPWQAAEGGVSVAKRFLVVMGVIIFVAIIIATFNVMERANMGFKTCVVEKEADPIYDYDMRVLSRRTAEAMLLDQKIEGLRFVGDALEPCGSAFIFEESAGTKYMVCENGLVYRMSKVCKGLGAAKKANTTKSCDGGAGDPARCIAGY